MEVECPRCHTANPADSRYCGNCATPLHPSDGVEAPTLDYPPGFKGFGRGTLFAGRYEIIEDLGEGGMGRVFRVLDTKIDEEVALKLIRPEIAADPKTIDRFSNELRIARRISHKNVCRMYHLSEEGGTHYFTMEYVDGEDLKNVLRMTKPLSERTAVGIAVQVCEGLAEAHRLSVVHRDLKPSNIIIDHDGNARILDFGIARSVDSEGVTRTGAMIGTPEYMSPEQVEGKAVGPQSDIYALGVILYEMVTGRLPFEGTSSLSVALKHKNEAARPPVELNPQISGELNRIILRLLEKSRDLRYATADELRGDLERLLGAAKTPAGETARTRAGTRPRVPGKAGARRRLAVGGIAVILTAAAAFLLFRKEAPETPPGTHSLVVLPFENLGAAGDEYFADGISEEITNRLAAVHGLSVISRTTAALYKRTQKTAKQIGEELGVDYALEGTVRWEKTALGGGRVRVTPKLVAASNSTQIWSESYDRVLEDVFSLQSEIAEEVTRKLDIAILEPERRILMAKPTKNIEAYDLFLKASTLNSKGYRENSPKLCGDAIELLERAVRLDPRFVQAYNLLSGCHYVYYMMGQDRSEGRLAKMKAAIDEALEIDPESPEARVNLAYYYYRGLQDYDRASQIFETVQKAYPQYSPFLLGYIQRRQGKWEESLRTLEKSFKINPRMTDLAVQIGHGYSALRRFTEAETWHNRALLIDPKYEPAIVSKGEVRLMGYGDTRGCRASLETLPRTVGTETSWFNLEWFERDFGAALKTAASMSREVIEESNSYNPRDLLTASVDWAVKDWPSMKTHASRALAVIEKALQERHEDHRVVAAHALALAFLGHGKEAVERAKQAVEMYPLSRDPVEGPAFLLNQAFVETIVGDLESAIGRLEQLLAVPAGAYLTVSVLRIDPSWDPLRGNPRFERLVK
ncbi:MAG TPA: protein kinase [Candidatus Aminicenantes bacterium]|nr:protein kinase [Candidatus Aminicenantes bacterium]